MSEEEKQMFNKMIYCNLINGEQALKFNRKYKDLQQKVEQLEKELNQEKEEYAGLHKVLNNKEEEFEKENYNNVVEISRLKRKVEQLENIRKEAIKLIEEDILGEKIENVNWDYDECYYSDMPAEIIKPLLNILKKGE